MNTEQYAAAVMNYAKDAQNSLDDYSCDSSCFWGVWGVDMMEGKRGALEDLIEFLHDLNKAHDISVS